MPYFDAARVDKRLCSEVAWAALRFSQAHFRDGGHLAGGRVSIEYAAALVVQKTSGANITQTPIAAVSH